ncbi:MAG: hypothetical protein ACT4PZ_13900 [Panacagrimonas sp.]
MEKITLWSMKTYENPLTEIGRGRTIAAFHVAQGSDELSLDIDMRRDVLTFLMSAKAVSYWLNEKKWLKLAREEGRLKFLTLTFEGRAECRASLRGAAAVRTTQPYVDDWKLRMRDGKQMECRKEFEQPFRAYSSA